MNRRIIIQCPSCGFKSIEFESTLVEKKHHDCSACGKTSQINDDQCCVICVFSKMHCLKTK